MNEQDSGSGSGLSVWSCILPSVLVVAALGVAAVVVMPMFARCVTPARPSNCQSNLKEWAIALQCYWADYDRHMPSSAVVSGAKKWSKSDFETFASGPGLPVQGQPRASWPQVLYEHVKNRDIAFCPSDDPHRTAVGARTSYWWKLAIDKAWYGEQCTQPCRKEGDFAYYADQIVLYERCGFHSGARTGLRNNVQVCAAFLDSHVKMINITNSLPANGKRWVTSPTALGEPAYFNYDNKTNTRMNPNTLANHVDPARFSDSF